MLSIVHFNKCSLVFILELLSLVAKDAPYRSMLRNILVKYYVQNGFFGGSKDRV